MINGVSSSSQRRRRRRESSDDDDDATGDSTARAIAMSPAEAAATRELIDELGELLALDHVSPNTQVVASSSSVAVAAPSVDLGLDPVSPCAANSFTALLTFEPANSDVDHQSASPQTVASDSSPVRADAVAPPATKKTKKSSTQRQKEELVYLRARAAELERDLLDLQTSSRDDSKAQLTTRDSAATMWERMAQRQSQETRRAQAENARLKHAIEEQLAIAKALERVLVARQIWHDERTPSDADDPDAAIFAQLAERVEARVTEADALFSASGCFGHTRESKLEANAMVNSSGNTQHIDFVEVVEVPFAFDAVARVTWKHMGAIDATLQAVAVDTIAMHQTECALTTKQTLQWIVAGRPRQVTLRSQYRRFRRADHVLMVWEAVADNTGSLRIHIAQQGCCKFAAVRTPDGAAAARVLTHNRVTPSVVVLSARNDDDNEASAAESDREGVAGVFTEVMLSSYRKSVAAVRQAIENDLMDEFFEHARDASSCSP